MQAEIPGQEQDGYDTEPNFFHGMHQHSQASKPRPQQRHGRLKRLKLAMTRSPHPPPPPVAAPPTTPPPVAADTTFRTHLRHLFARSSHHATSPVVDVPFTKAKERTVAADAPGKDPNIVPYEDQDPDTTQPDPNTQQPQQRQQQPVAVQVDTGEHGGSRSCCCF
ncbi:hypothetical protein DFJ58DRAFT_839088 [Suillus subalutaceus]|uniref:uncharacterized protein n=1 Tax=Suillus subalutaceus TaxID=48586 RepID=UPI001B863DD9|nr:uncharacterized protein DFJ58DRAFT_839088 [Suillus subalutaceus]KAG1863564.1 hypothetical protein DFJ58DRAFT_839088 [Suillus subalutaceus]